MQTPKRAGSPQPVGPIQMSRSVTPTQPISNAPAARPVPPRSDSAYSDTSTHNDHANQAAVYQSGFNGVVFNLINTTSPKNLKSGARTASSEDYYDPEATPTDTRGPGFARHSSEPEEPEETVYDDDRMYDYGSSYAASRELEEAMAAALESFSRHGLERLTPKPQENPKSSRRKN